MEQREQEVLQEEKRLKQQRSLEWELQNHGIYQKYQELENKLAQIPAWEDRFEQVLDELESCRHNCQMEWTRFKRERNSYRRFVRKSD